MHVGIGSTSLGSVGTVAKARMPAAPRAQMQARVPVPPDPRGDRSYWCASQYRAGYWTAKGYGFCVSGSLPGTHVTHADYVGCVKGAVAGSRDARQCIREYYDQGFITAKAYAAIMGGPPLRSVHGLGAEAVPVPDEGHSELLEWLLPGVAGVLIGGIVGFMMGRKK